MNLVMSKATSEHELLFNKPNSGQFVEQKLALSCSFGHDQIHCYQKYDLGYEQKLILSSCFKFDQNELFP